MRKFIIGLVMATATGALLSPAQAVEKQAKTPEQACQAQALASIARGWSNVLSGQFEIIVKGDRCLVFLQSSSTMFKGKRAAWLIDGKTGTLLSEFWAPSDGSGWKDSDRGLCSYRGGKFPNERVLVERVFGQS